ncbi:MAG: histidine phosphatase family protein [Alphaproteobacteria bacterium]|nr:histidine phosphatase family protein [Alphaproteobacteria bacterium]
MKALLILRHAKAEKGDGDLDRKRRLTKIGLEDARRIGALLRKTDMEPDCALCSPARRARETLEGVTEAFAKQPKSRFSDKLYNAFPDSILNEIAGAPESCSRLLVVGHNPGLHQLALDLADPGRSPPDLLRRLADGFSPGTLVTFTFEVEIWADIAPRRGVLSALVGPEGS